MRIENHLLIGDEVKQVPVEGKSSGPFASGRPDTIVIHFTCGGSAESALETFNDPEVYASAHVLVDREGTPIQLIPFDRTAWHAGRSEWRGRSGLNAYALGIEIVNAGPLERQGEEFVSWWGKRYSGSEVMEGAHRNEASPRYWHRYTPEQLATVREICLCLTQFSRITEILGHEEIAPGRKVDPGPAFDLDGLRWEVLGAQRPQISPDRVVTANALNFRQAPDGRAALAGDPLSRGTPVRVLEQRGDWSRVAVTREGWVASRFLTPT